MNGSYWLDYASEGCRADDDLPPKGIIVYEVGEDPYEGVRGWNSGACK